MGIKTIQSQSRGKNCREWLLNFNSSNQLVNVVPAIDLFSILKTLKILNVDVSACQIIFYINGAKNATVVIYLILSALGEIFILLFKKNSLSNFPGRHPHRFVLVPLVITLENKDQLLYCLQRSLEPHQPTLISMTNFNKDLEHQTTGSLIFRVIPNILCVFEMILIQNIVYCSVFQVYH